MTRRAGAGLAAAAVAYLALVVALAARAGTNYEEVVPYVLTPLDIRPAGASAAGAPPRFVVSEFLPRLAFEPAADRRLPLLNQLYMTDHLSYGGVLAGRLAGDWLWGARLWHAAFGVLLLVVLYDLAGLLGLGTRGALLAVAIAATSVQLTTCYGVARFDESLASFGSVVVPWAALRHARRGGGVWIWIGVLAAALAISGKITALWPLAGLAAAGWAAGWRPPPLRALGLPALVAAPLFAPMIGFALAGPATGGEVGRRLAFVGDLFTTGVVAATFWNLILYLGSWGSVISVAALGNAARGPNWIGCAIIVATLVWLVARTAAPGPLPRRRRLEAQMLLVAGVVFACVALFFRERHDYQFQLLVPLYALAVAAALEWTARRVLDHRLPAWAAGLVVAALPLATNLWDQRAVHADLARTLNPMVGLAPQQASAQWLAAHGIRQPIVPTFYAVGTYELLTAGAVRPIYPFPLFRHPKSRLTHPDYETVWREVLAGAGPQYVVLPAGTNPIEASHFDEPAIRAALQRVADGERVAVFATPQDVPLLEIWRVTPRGGAPAGAR